MLSIAVLVAIAIPIFTTQLEKSREAVDLANIRALYAEVAADVLTAPNGTEGISRACGTFKQTNIDTWLIDVSDVAGVSLPTKPSDCKYFNVSKAGVPTFTSTAAY